jgi:hypothetical protein
VPGADAVSLLSELGSSWDDEVDAWASSAATFGAQITAASDDAEGTDAEAGGLFGGLLGPLGGG